jgi:hypothetical protein
MSSRWWIAKREQFDLMYDVAPRCEKEPQGDAVQLALCVNRLFLRNMSGLRGDWVGLAHGF